MFSPFSPQPSVDGASTVCSPVARCASGNTLPTSTSQSGSSETGMKTPEMNERMTTLKGAIAEAASVEEVKVVSATPRQQNVNVPSTR
jgi:hypothetical protein